MTLKHVKTVSIADPTQADLDAQIALGNYPAGTKLINIALGSDWNAEHTSGSALNNQPLQANGTGGFKFGAVVTSVQLVTTLAGINALNTSQTLAYTNSSGLNLIITDAIVRCTAANAVTNGPTIAVGTSAGGTQIFPATAANALITTTDVFGFTLVGMSKIVPNGGMVYFNVTAGSTGTSQIIACDILGYFL